ncbi:MAG TPA: enhanced serine sensitivity protein SseB C-terminal domain-containing protein [Phycisphaerales bacterium]|nr:enhanced serine sensitivity protein SseB C-terminal domain-containing protein [Phycisphaerales bacterium]
MFHPFFKEGILGWPFNDLERALEAGLTDPARMPAFWGLFLQSKVLALAKNEVPESGTGSILAVFTAPEGHAAIIAFTSPQVAQATILEPTPMSEISLPTLLEYLGETSIVLNPSGPYGKEFLAAELRAGRQGVTRTGRDGIHVAPGTQVFFGALAEDPLELIEAVTSVCRADETIHSVFISGVCVPAAGDTAAHPLIGIDAHDFAAAKARISRAMGGWTSRENKPVDFINMREAGTFADHLKKDGKRIYKKRGWLGSLLG